MNELYEELEKPEGEGKIFRIAKARDQATKDFSHMKQIKIDRPTETDRPTPTDRPTETDQPRPTDQDRPTKTDRPRPTDPDRPTENERTWCGFKGPGYDYRKVEGLF